MMLSITTYNNHVHNHEYGYKYDRKRCIDDEKYQWRGTSNHSRLGLVALVLIPPELVAPTTLGYLQNTILDVGTPTIYTALGYV